MPVASQSKLAELREQLQRMDGSFARTRTVLPFSVPQIDQRLPGGGLALNALHEVAGGADGAVHGAAAALFCAGVAARTHGKILWCITRADLFAPAVEQAGLRADRVVFIEAGDDTSLLSYFEEGLAHGGLGPSSAKSPSCPWSRLVGFSTPPKRRAPWPWPFGAGDGRATRRTSDSRPPPSVAGGSRLCPRRQCRNQAWVERAGFWN